MFDEILVPTDGSDCAEAAVKYAQDLAMRYEATVHVLCVVDRRKLDNAPHKAERERMAEEIVEETRDRLTDSVLTVEPTVRTDVPHEAILEYATEQDVDLVVMGTHGRTGVDRYLLGSVTEKVVRLSDAPVLTVKESTDGGATYPYTDVLVPTDGSTGAEVAVPPAVDIAKTYDARVHAVSVLDTVALGLDVRSTGVLDSLEARARSAVNTVEGRATGASVSDVETAVEFGSPYQEINAYVDEHDVDLVVMGTHGRSGIERYLLGSVAEKVVRTCQVPVLTVRQST